MAVGHISRDHFEHEETFNPDEKIYEECALMMMTTGQTTFIHGSPERWHELMELIE